MTMKQVRQIERIVTGSGTVAERRTQAEAVEKKLTDEEEQAMAEFYLAGLDREGDFTDEELAEVAP